MKIIAIGIGQCGCNIADEFYAINSYARSFFGRGIEILIDALAVNTDETDLASIKHIPPDKRHRIVIGTAKTFGHGVGKVNLEGAKIMKETHSIISDNVLNSARFHESDGIVVIASGAGGTGSGGIGWLIKGLKERIEKPVYAIVVLPFGYEEKGDASYAVTNTATCLKTVSQYADGVFLLDNERFGKADIGLAANLKEINHRMVWNFFDLFCAGEEKKQKYIGSKVLDAGDIKQSLEAISTVGRGEVNLPGLHRLKKDHYKEAAKESISAVGALGQALNNLCLKVNIEDARRILILVTAPKDIITLNVLEEISNSLAERSPKSQIRIGDYPRRGKQISVTLILSKLITVARMENLFLRAEQSLKKQEEIEAEAEQRITQLYQTGANVPTLDNI